MSTSLCGDGYVLDYARDSGRDVAALSWQSGGPLSRARGYARASADAETLVALAPDVLVLGPGESVRDGLLSGTRVVRLDWTEDLDGVEANRAKLGRSEPEQSELGQGDEAQPTPDPPLDAPRILYLSRSGGTAGPGTYVDAAIRAAGARNLVSRPGWFTPDPEWVVAQDPDVVVTSFFGSYESVNASALRNRTVAAFIARHPRIDVPGSLWPCAGPGLEDAVDLIREGLE